MSVPVYVARFAEVEYVLHAFQQKTQKTARKDIDLVRGKIEKFTIDMLVNMLARTRKHVKVKVTSEAA